CHLMDIVEVQESPALGKLYPASWPATVSIRAGGRAMETTVIHPRGDPEHPLGWEDIKTKLRSVSCHCRTAIPVEELAAASQELDFQRAIALLPNYREPWRDVRAV